MMNRTVAFALIGLLMAGCTAAKPATVAQPPKVSQPTSEPPAASEESGPIQMIRDGQHLHSVARMQNGTLYLPLQATDPAEQLPAPITNGRIELAPGTGFDIAGSKLYMRAGEQPIVPPLLEENGVVWAPASFYRTSGWRIQYDAQARTVTMTPAQPQEHPFPEEIPADVTAFMKDSGPAPRLGIFRTSDGLTFVALSTAGSSIRLIDPGSSDTADAGRVFIARAGEAGATDRVLRMLFPVPLPVGIQVWLERDGQGAGGKQPARFFVGESQDAVLSREEAEGRVSPPVPRSTPTDVVLHYSDQLGVAPGEIGPEEISGDRASVKITKLGQVFYAHLKRGTLGWQLVATTWGVPCQEAQYCALAMQKGVR